MDATFVKPQLSIVYCYRDRDILRVRRSIQSLAGIHTGTFEVIFVDYGSDTFYSEQVSALLSAFPFVKYLRNETQGRPWNRAHALNSGIRHSASDFIFTADIDLIFTKDFLSVIHAQRSPDSAVFFSVYLLPGDFKDWSGINNHSGFPKTTNQGLGISLIPKTFFAVTGGYDESFSIWGYEDNELFGRFSAGNLQSVFYDVKPIAYHQWHPHAYEDVRSFPRGWRSFMQNIYLFEKKDQAPLNFAMQGKVYKYEDRPAWILLKDQKTVFTSLQGDRNYLQYFCQKTFDSLSSGDFFACSFEEGTYIEYERARLTKLIRTVNGWLKRFNLGFELKSKFEELHLSVYQIRDLLCYFCVTNKTRTSDFAWVLSEQDRKISFVIVKA